MFKGLSTQRKGQIRGSQNQVKNGGNNIPKMELTNTISDPLLLRTMVLFNSLGFKLK